MEPGGTVNPNRKGTQTSTADQLAKLADPRDRGVITPEEF